MTCQRIDGSTDRRIGGRTCERHWVAVPYTSSRKGKAAATDWGSWGGGDGDAGLEWGAQLVSSVSDLMGFKFG